jgi:hypothetical protein
VIATDEWPNRSEITLRDSASQGALNRAVLVQQGHITEAGCQEQAESYRALTIC